MNPAYLQMIMTLLSPVLKKFKADVLRWFIKQEFYRRMCLHIVPLLRLSTYYTDMRGWIYHRGYKLLQPGDMVLVVDRRKLSTMVIGGEFAHAGLCVSKDETFECAEMTHHHYTKSTFADMCFEADRVVIIRCKDFDADYIQKVIAKCLSLQGAKYDTEFGLNNDFLYCSELIYESDFERRLQINLEDLAGIGNQYISPTGLFKAKNVEVVWDSSKEVL